MGKEIIINDYHTNNKLISLGFNEYDKQQLNLKMVGMLADNPALEKCDKYSLLDAVLKIKSFNFEIGTDRAYVIPYGTKAQFQMGYKGFIELAMRTGSYININVSNVKDGEYKGKSRLTGEYDWEFIANEEMRDKTEIIGYVAFFKLKNGFEKTLYMTNKEIDEHLKEFSKAYAYKNKKGNIFNSASNKEKMFSKTVIKALLRTYGILSTDMGTALKFDGSAIDKNGKPDYVDNPIEVKSKEIVAPKKEEIVEEIKKTEDKVKNGKDKVIDYLLLNNYEKEYLNDLNDKELKEIFFKEKEVENLK